MEHSGSPEQAPRQAGTRPLPLALSFTSQETAWNRGAKKPRQAGGLNGHPGASASVALPPTPQSPWQAGYVGPGVGLWAVGLYPRSAPFSFRPPTATSMSPMEAR